MTRTILCLGVIGALCACEKDSRPNTAPEPTASRVKAPSDVPETPAVEFGVYLLEDPSITGPAAARIPLQDLRLQDAPLLTLDDVVTYEWDTHKLALTERGASKIPQQVETHGMPFVVVGRGKRVYLGAFWTSMSSQSFGHPVIDVDRAQDGPTIPFTFIIARAYPTPAHAAGDDPRENDLLWNALYDADKMGEIADGEAVDGEVTVRWVKDKLFLRSTDGVWRTIPRPASAWSCSTPQIARSSRYVTVALPQPDSVGDPLVEFLTTTDHGRHWKSTVAVASMESASIEPGAITLSVSDRGRIHATVEWSQGVSCAVTYSSEFEGKVDAVELTLRSETDI